MECVKPATAGDSQGEHIVDGTIMMILFRHFRSRKIAASFSAKNIRLEVSVIIYTNKKNRGENDNEEKIDRRFTCGNRT